MNHQWSIFGGYPLLDMISDNKLALRILKAINMMTFYGLNWVFLFIMIYSVFKIRHNRDRLEVRMEMCISAACWSFFAGLQYVFYAFSQNVACKHKHPFFQIMTEYSQVFSYVSIICRDLSVTACMIYFLVKVNNYEGTIKAQLEVEDNLSDLVDLSTILDSVAPLYSFSSYLDKHKPDYKFLLKLIKAYRQYQELMAESGENREHANSIAS